MFLNKHKSITVDPDGTVHYVCTDCGENMHRIWDTVCFLCRKTFCYDDSIAFKGKWYCKKCIRKGRKPK